MRRARIFIRMTRAEDGSIVYVPGLRFFKDGKLYRKLELVYGLRTWDEAVDESDGIRRHMESMRIERQEYRR